MDYDMAIAELKTRRDAASIAIVKLDERVTKHDEIIEVLVDSLATKDDIAGLRTDLRERDELAAERMDHYRERIMSLEEKHAAELASRAAQATASEGRFNRRMSWGMLILFVVDVVLVVLQMKGSGHGK
jgi:predicted  nucleic acid-binding Zn-ribbon protein